MLEVFECLFKRIRYVIAVQDSVYVCVCLLFILAVIHIYLRECLTPTYVKAVKCAADEGA